MARRTIRDISISKKHKNTSKKESSDSGQGKKKSKKGSTKKATTSRSKTGPTVRPRSEQENTQGGGYTPTYGEHSRSRAGWWILLVLVLLAIGGIVWTVLGTATLQLVPESKRVTLDTEFPIKKHPASGVPVTFQSMKLSDSITKKVAVSEFVNVSKKASGTITIYNEEPSPQKLIEETRFESSDGLIYKTPKNKSIKVPAAQGDVPGTATTVVYAAEPGPEYNIGRDDFVIPGWRERGSSKFNTQYARSKTEITGGVIGKQPATNTTKIEKIKQQLNVKLRKRLTEKAEGEIPERFIVPNNAQNLVVGDSSVTPSDTNAKKSLVSRSATLSTLLIEKEELGGHLARLGLQDNETKKPSAVILTNSGELDITVGKNRQSLSVAGEAQFEWQIPIQQLLEDLRGAPKADFQSLISKYPSVKQAEVSTEPFWKLTLPESFKRFSVYRTRTSHQENCVVKEKGAEKCWYTQLDFE